MNKPLIAHTALELQDLLSKAKSGVTIYVPDEATPWLQLPCIQLCKQNRPALIRSIGELAQ